MSVNRYTAPIPAGAIITETRAHLNSVVRANPYTVLYEEAGGFFLKDEAGTTIAVAADALIPELERAFEESYAPGEKEQLEAEKAARGKKGGEAEETKP